MNLATGELADFDPRRDLDTARGQLAALLADPDDAALAAALAALAAAHPLALAELSCGPRSPGGERLVRAVLPHAAALEGALSARGAWLRLAELAGEAAPAVLAAAATRHPAAAWLVALSRRVEGEQAGATHLFAAASHPAFAAACRAHAEAGHVEGLVLAASATGRPEPAAALLAVNLEAALRAAGAALDANPRSPVIAWLAAVWGPEPDGLFLRVVPLLRSRAAAESLLDRCRHLPRSAERLRMVLKGMPA